MQSDLAELGLLHKIGRQKRNLTLLYNDMQL